VLLARVLVKLRNESQLSCLDDEMVQVYNKHMMMMHQVDIIGLPALPSLDEYQLPHLPQCQRNHTNTNILMLSKLVHGLAAGEEYD